MSRSRRTATRRTGQSLRGRLAWVATSVTAGWLVALAVGGTLLLGVALSRQADDVLRARAEAAAATMFVGPDGTVTVTEARDDRALDIGTWIFDGTGAVVETPSGSSANLTRIAASLAGHGERSLDLGPADPLRLLALPVGSGDLTATVVTSGSLAPYRQLQRAALIAIGVVAPLVLLGVYLVSRSTLARALRPVQQMSAQAAEWSAEHVERRFGLEPRPTELAELAGTLDGMLDRLAAVLRHERQLSAELSHELRTPLARIQAEIDLVRSRPRGAEELSRAHLTIDAAVDRMRQVLETLMSTARAVSGAPPGRCDPVQVVAELIARLPPGGPTVTSRGEPAAWVGLDAPVLERLLSPVLDNAARYAAGRVLVEFGRTGGSVEFRVTDDGPGVPADATAHVFEPGFRADPADGHDGAGLGLALSHRLIRAVEGRISVANVDSGTGAVFTLRVPAS